MIDFEVQGRTAVITINRPEARNAVDGEVARGLEAAIDRFEADDELWTAVLTGAGNVFSAGADLKLFAERRDAEMFTERGNFGGFVRLERTKPVIAAVDGPALGGGCELALACDLIVASTAARFGQPEVKRSLVAAAGGLVRLPRVLPARLATYLLLTGDPLDAQRALRLRDGKRADRARRGARRRARPGRTNQRERAVGRASHPADHPRRPGPNLCRDVQARSDRHPRAGSDRGLHRGTARVRREALARLEGSLTLDPRQPVLVGVGQVTYREGDAPEPVDLLAEAVRRAADDCRAASGGAQRVLDAVGSVRVVNIVSRRYPDPGRLVAQRLGLTPTHTMYTTGGGQTPHQLVDRACDDIAAGRVDAVMIGGAESWRTRSAIKRRGEASTWSTQPSDVRPSQVFGDPLEMSSPEESALGLTDPLQAYPLFEQALRVRHGRSLDEQVAVASALWARCSQIARHNEFAAIRTPRTAEAIGTPSPDNRMVAFPYTKLMSSNATVDQAGALLMCSAEQADAFGVPRDRWVFLHGAGEAQDVPFLTERHDLASSPAIAAAGSCAFALAGVGLDDLAHIDLYSCFPSAVEVAAEALGLPLVGRDLSVTGGLTFAGGPWNEYVVHSIATMAGVLRNDPDAMGLVSANGGFLTKHVVGVWSCRPPVAGSRWRSVQPELDASVPRRAGAPHHVGSARLETYTVLHDREGAPERAWAFALTDDGGRTLGVADDHDLLVTLEREDVLGARVELADGSLLGLA